MDFSTTYRRLIWPKKGFWLILSAVFPALSFYTGDTSPYICTHANIWQLEIAGPGKAVVADYEGNISLRSLESGKSLWSFPARAFVFDLKCADLNLDGDLETAAVTAQGDLIVLNSKGEKVWGFHSALPLYNVVVGNFSGNKALEVACGGIDRYVYVFDASGSQIARSEEMEMLVHRLASGNLQGDDYDEILVVENRVTANLLALQNNTLKSLWRKPLKVSEALINWENPRGSFFPFSITIDDIDNNGTCEILMGDTYFNKQAVMVCNNMAEPLWISDGLPPFKSVDGEPLEFYSTAFVRSADIFPEHPGKEIISVAGGMFRIWDKNGRLLGSRNSRLGFTDMEVSGKTLVLGSCPNGDEFIYNIPLDSNWENIVASLEFRGHIKNIKDNTERLSQQVMDYKPKAVPANRYHIINGFSASALSISGVADALAKKEAFLKTFPYPNLQLVRNLKVMEKSPPLDENGNPWSPGRWKVDALTGTNTVDEIIEKAKFVEENKIPTLFYIGHSCMPFITLETAEKILQTAPNYCVGFQTAEDEHIELIPRYFEHYFKPLANLCLKYGNKLCITKNKGLWWMSSPSHREVFDAMFEGGRDKVSLASTENSNSRTPEINLFARGGLWQAGLLKNNNVSIHADLFSFNRFHQWEYPRTGNQYLRLMVAHTSLGMTMFNNRIRETQEEEMQSFETLGRESTAIFYHLLGKGLVFSPDRHDIVGYSSVGIVVHQPPKKWLTDAHNGHNPKLWLDDEELHNAVFPHNGSLWGMTNTPDHVFQKVVFNKDRQFGYHIPPTPFGLVAIVPEFTNLGDVAGVTEWWHTNGIDVWKDEKQKFKGKAAAEKLCTDFARAAEKLPFRLIGDAVFMQVVKMGPHHYRLILVDPGWLNPKDHNVTVKIQLPGKFQVENMLEKVAYPVKNSTFTCRVNAGLFCIIDVSKQ